MDLTIAGRRPVSQMADVLEEITNVRHARPNVPILLVSNGVDGPLLLDLQASAYERSMHWSWLVESGITMRERYGGMQVAGGAQALQAQGKSLHALSLDFEDGAALRRALRGCDAVMHTAGPYKGKTPDVLQVCSDTCACRSATCKLGKHVAAPSQRMHA